MSDPTSQVAIDDQIGCCFVRFSASARSMKDQRGGRWDQGTSRIKIRLSGVLGTGRLLCVPCRRQNPPPGGGVGGTTRTHSFVLPLIEPTFCLGSIWAKLELAFLASVNFIIQRIQCASCTLFVVLFCSHMDQMNFTHPYICNACPPDFGPTETLHGNFSVRM